MGVAIAGAVVAAGATAYSAYSASESQDAANSANAGNTAATNALNREMFYEGRGKHGSAILPLYFGKQEKRLARDTTNFYDKLRSRRPLKRVLSKAEEAQSRFADTQLAAEDTARDVFTGEIRDEALANLAPLAAERLRSADTVREAGQMALADAMSKADAEAALQGFTGSTFQGKLLRAELTRKNLTEAAQVEATARERNETDTFGIRQNDINRRLSNLALPGQMVRQRVDFQNLPENAALDQEARRQQLFNFFRISPGQFTYSPMPTVQPVNGVGNIVAQGVASGAGTIGNYYAQKNLINQMNQQNGGGNYDPNAPAWYNQYLNQPVNQAQGGYNP